MQYLPHVKIKVVPICNTTKEAAPRYNLYKSCFTWYKVMLRFVIKSNMKFVFSKFNLERPRKNSQQGLQSKVFFFVSLRLQNLFNIGINITM